MPPTLAPIVAEVLAQAGLTLHDVGLYLDGPGGSTRAALAGVRKGLAAVSVAPADPFNLVDADVAGLSPFALDRVVDEAILHALRLALQRWDLALASAGMAPLAKADEGNGGTAQERKRATAIRAAELSAACSAPYREPSAQFVRAEAQAINPYPGRFGGFPCNF